MTSCQCQGIEACFNPRLVTHELNRYRRKGAPRSTRHLIAALQSQGVTGMTLLDIGGGIGAIQHAMLRDGVTTATVVDASTAYLGAAREEAQRLNLSNRIHFEHGNFVDLAPEIAPADIVTLDRVICCYDDMSGLVDASAARATHLYGLVYPRSLWWLRAANVVRAWFTHITRNPMQFFVHSPEAVDAIVRARGFQQRFYDTVGLWQVIVYERTFSGHIG